VREADIGRFGTGLIGFIPLRSACEGCNGLAWPRRISHHPTVGSHVELLSQMYTNARVALGNIIHAIK
jgi:hypothetical protein